MLERSIGTYVVEEEDVFDAGSFEEVEADAEVEVEVDGVEEDEFEEEDEVVEFEEDDVVELEEETTSFLPRPLCLTSAVNSVKALSKA